MAATLLAGLGGSPMVWTQGLLLLLASTVERDADPPQITPVGGDPTRIVVSVRLSRQTTVDVQAGAVPQVRGQRWLQLVVLRDDGTTGAPMFAGYHLRGRRLTCTPRFALEHDRVYRAVFRTAGRPAVTTDYRVPPRKPRPETRVERVFPSTGVLPANHLKFYIHFSQPMREGKAIFDHIALVDQRGQVVEDPWRRTELWSDDVRRLTLWIHPGRVKRGVNLREEVGPVLQPGSSYTLRIGRGVKDQYDRSLKHPYRKTFQVVAADHRRPLPRSWKRQLPRAGTRAALQIEFGEALDQPLLQRFLSIVDDQGRKVPGLAVAKNREFSWRFTPEAAWKPLEYRLQVNPLLEDLAGNTPLRVFDTDLDQPALPQPELEIRFRPRER